MQVLNITAFEDELSRILLLGFLGFIFATIITPVYTNAAYKYKFWKKLRTATTTGEKATVLARLHRKKHTRRIPTMAGLIFLTSIVFITVMFNFSREQTWLPIAATVGAGIVGLIDDVINIRGLGGGVAGLSTRLKLLLITLVGLLGGWYFYYKLGYDALHLTFGQELIGVSDVTVGPLLVLIFAFAVVATANAVNISDGLDGLAGGLVAMAFLAYGLIAALQGNFGLAGFCLTVVGSLLSYVWFNIFPARFFMGDVGSFALGTALAVVAMLTDTLLLLPFIGIVFFVEAGSSFFQIASKRFLGRKIFKAAPVHHHFEAIGWPETKVTMRFWVIGQVAAVVGLIMAVLGGHI